MPKKRQISGTAYASIPTMIEASQPAPRSRAPPHRPTLSHHASQGRDGFPASRRRFIQLPWPALRPRDFSSGRAAPIAGLPRAQFLLSLDRFGPSPFGTDPDELEQDIANALA